jgi:hypothetical protein
MSKAEYYAYLLIDGQISSTNFKPIKLYCNEIMFKLLEVEIGDFLSIKGLGHLQVVNTYFNSSTYDGTVFNEIGIICNRIRGA